MGELKLKNSRLPFRDDLDIEFADSGETTVYTKKGNHPIGKFAFSTEDQPYKSLPDTMSSNWSQVHPDFKGQNIATDAYKAAEQHYGRKVLPDDVQSGAGFGLHDSKGYGKDFGMSEMELESKLSPMDKNLRNMRKNALEQTLNEVSDGIYDNGDWHSTSLIANGALQNKPSGKMTNLGTLLDHSMGEAWDAVNNKIDGAKLRASIPAYLSKVKGIVPVAGAGLATYAALNTPDASAAVGDFLIPGGLEGAGEVSGTEREMLAEHDARANYSKSGARADALKKIKNGY